MRIKRQSNQKSSVINADVNYGSINSSYCNSMGSDFCCNILKPCSIEEHLAALATRTSMAQALYGIWIGDKLRIAKMLSLISSPPFQTFSDHGSGHSEMILSIMSRLLGNRLCQLGATDTWMLLQCAYRHDLGMYIEYKDIQNALVDPAFVKCLNKSLYDDNSDMRESAKNVSERLEDLKARYANLGETANHMPDLTRHFMVILARYFRRRHAERSKKLLLNEMEESTDHHLVPMRIWRLIADICAGHGSKGKLDTIKRPYKEMGLDNDEIHPRLIQILLRLGDTLDLDNNRFNNYQLAQWGVEGDAPFDSQAHIRKHKSLAHLHVDTKTVSLIARMDYSDNKRPPIHSTMSDEAYWERIREKSKLFEHEKLHAGEVAHELGETEQRLMEKMIELEEQRKYDRKILKIKQAASRLVRQYMHEIKDELDFFALNWQFIAPESFCSSAPVFDATNSEIWWRSKKLDEEIVDLEYTMSHRRASEIMQGTSLYGDANYEGTSVDRKYYHRLIFLREFVQNGMDAMKIQLYRNIINNKYGTSPKLDDKKPINWQVLDVMEIVSGLPHYKMMIEVHYRLTDDALIFRIIDSGSGIDKKTMKLMKDVGATRPHEIQEEISKMPDWLRPSGGFGIGMQSVYAVTNSFVGVSQAYSDQKKHLLMFDYKQSGGSLFAEEFTDGDETENNRYKKYKFGTMFEIEITRERIVEDQEDLMFEGVTSYDYDVKCVFKQIKDRISLLLGQDIFPIQLRFFVDDVEVKAESSTPSNFEIGAFDWIYKIYTKSIVVPFADNDHCFTCFDEHNGKSMIRTFNKVNNMLLDICFTNASHTEYFYRGQNVPEVRETGLFIYPGCEIVVRHWGRKAEDTLVVSRNKLLTEAKSPIYQQITESVDEALGMYIGHIKNDISLLDGLNIRCLAEAIYHYSIRTAYHPTVVTLNKDDCINLYNNIVHLLKHESHTHKGLTLDYTTAKTSDNGVLDSSIYKKPFTQLWYIHRNAIYKRNDKEKLQQFNRGANDTEDDYGKSIFTLGKNEFIDYAFSCTGTELGADEFILFDDHLQCLYRQRANVYVSKINYLTFTRKEYPQWIYQLSDKPIDMIGANDATQTAIIEHALIPFRYDVDDEKERTKYDYPLVKLLRGRPVVPGFEIFRGLNVHTLPTLNENFDDTSFYTQLGNYFIWPFSYNQLERINDWFHKPFNNNADLTNPDMNFLKKCKIIAKALNKDNRTYRALIKFVSENLSPNSQKWSTPGRPIGDYASKETIERNICERYEEIIIRVLWPRYLYPLFCSGKLNANQGTN